MGRLISSAIASLDGYVADAEGRFDWAEPDAEVHAFVNDLERPVGTYLSGRRMYDVMTAWETLPLTGQPTHMRDFAEMWRAANKVVYSRSGDRASTARTRIARDFDPAAVRAMKAAAERDLSSAARGWRSTRSGPGSSTSATSCRSSWAAARALPDGVRAELELLGERRFGNGMVHVGYRVRGVRWRTPFGRRSRRLGCPTVRA